MKNKGLNIVVMILSTLIMGYFFVYTRGLENLIKQAEKLDRHWITLAVACIVMFWLFETTVLHIITSALYPKHKLFIRSFRFTMIGQFFGAFTPFSSGSQPSQIYAMSDAGIPGGEAGSILMIKFIIHELGYLAYLMVALIFRFNFFNNKISYFIYFCVVGIVINIIIIFIALLVSINKEIPKKINNFTFKLLQRIKFIKNSEEKHKNFEKEIVSFHNNAKLLSKNKFTCTLAALFTIFQWGAYYAIPYCIYRSFGFNSESMFTLVMAQVFLTMFMSCIPLPGAEGGAEAGFYIIFGLFFNSSTIVPAIFIWRIVTYYLTIVVGSIFAVFLPNNKINKND